MYKIILLLSFLLNGCTVKPDANLYSLFLQMSNSVSTDNIIKDREIYFSPHYLSEVNTNDKKSLFLLRLSGYIKKADSNFQSVDGDKGCLSVNGFEANDDPVSIYLEYKKDKGEWRVNNILLNFVDNIRLFATQAVCPDDLEPRSSAN